MRTSANADKSTEARSGYITAGSAFSFCAPFRGTNRPTSSMSYSEHSQAVLRSPPPPPQWTSRAVAGRRDTCGVFMEEVLCFATVLVVVLCAKV